VNAANNASHKKKIQQQKQRISSLQKELKQQKREKGKLSKEVQKERSKRKQSELMLHSRFGGLQLTPQTAKSLQTLFSSKKGAEMQQSIQYLESKRPVVKRKLDNIRAKKTAEDYAAGISHARAIVQQETLGTAVMMVFGTSTSQSAFQKMLTAQRSMTTQEIRTAKEIEAAKPKFPKQARFKPMSQEEESRRRELANSAYAWLEDHGIDWESGGHYSAMLPGLSFIGLEWVYQVGDTVQLEAAAGAPAGGDGSISRCHTDGSCYDIKFASGEERKEVPVTAIVSLKVPMKCWLTREGTHAGRGVDYTHALSGRLKCILQSKASPKLVERDGKLVTSTSHSCLYHRGANIRRLLLQDPDGLLREMGPDHPFLKKSKLVEASEGASEGAEGAEGAEGGGGEVRARLRDRVREGVRLGCHCTAVTIRNEARRNLNENEWRGEYLRGNGKQVPSPNEDQESVYRLRKENGQNLLTLEAAKRDPWSWLAIKLHRGRRWARALVVLSTRITSRPSHGRISVIQSIERAGRCAVS
jgi:hypothetical protein